MGALNINGPVTPMTDPRLSLKAVGAWSLLVRMADQDQMVVKSAFKRLCEANDVDGQQSVRTAMRELTDYGYVSKTRMRYPGGAISGYAWRLNASPEVMKESA